MHINKVHLLRFTWDDNRLFDVFNGGQLAKMKKSISDMSLPWNL